MKFERPRSGLAEKIKHAFKTRWYVPIMLPLFVIPASVLKTLEEDGRQVLGLQKSALVLEVFSKTDLPPQDYRLLEETLRSLNGVKDVMAVSPEESLSRVLADPKLGIDPSWLLKRKEDLKGKDTIIPWSYVLYLGDWDEKSLVDLKARIEGLTVGLNKSAAVSEVHYDPERWSLAFALFNYLRWITWVLGLCLGAALATLIFLAVKLRRSVHWNTELIQEGTGFLALGVAGGILSHILLLAVLSFSFFPETSSWRSHLGHSLGFQIGLSVLFSFCAHAVLNLSHK